MAIKNRRWDPPAKTGSPSSVTLIAANNDENKFDNFCDEFTNFLTTFFPNDSKGMQMDFPTRDLEIDDCQS